MSYLGWLISLVCIFTGGTVFFSVNSIALRIFSPVKLNEAFKRSNREKLTESFLKNSEKLVLTCSLYRIILNVCIILLLMAVFGSGKERLVNFTGYIFAFMISLAIFSVFSLAIPHAWAKYSGEKILSRTYKLLLFFSIVAWPVLYIFQLYDALIRRLAGVVKSTPQEQQEEKEEEFLTELEQQKMEGVVDEEEQQMIENVLELTDTTAEEIITPRTDIVAIESNSDLNTVLEIISKAGHSRFPVYQENIDNIIGLVYAKDLLTEIGKSPADFKLTDKLRDAYFVPETKPLRELLREFQSQKLHIAIVLDEYGGTAGIVTLEDIIEELVGEITDEYEKIPPKPIRKIDKNTIEVDARTYVDDLNDEFELNLPENEDYDTIGGFVFSYLGYIPKTGEQFEYERLKFSIAAAEPRRVKSIRIQKVPEEQ